MRYQSSFAELFELIEDRINPRRLTFECVVANGVYHAPGACSKSSAVRSVSLDEMLLLEECILCSIDICCDGRTALQLIAALKDLIRLDGSISSPLSQDTFIDLALQSRRYNYPGEYVRAIPGLPLNVVWPSAFEEYERDVHARTRELRQSLKEFAEGPERLWLLKELARRVITLPKERKDVSPDLAATIKRSFETLTEELASSERQVLIPDRTLRSTENPVFRVLEDASPLYGTARLLPQVGLEFLIANGTRRGNFHGNGLDGWVKSTDTAEIFETASVSFEDANGTKPMSECLETSRALA